MLLVVHPQLLVVIKSLCSACTSALDERLCECRDLVLVNVSLNHIYKNIHLQLLVVYPQLLIVIQGNVLCLY